ncbi:UNVERIFIED_CONTAM: hypothetical protein Slati_3000000 [Sesamum latifolium]|uniref:Uncharacterized protein n=1 Tax=Sesamum latifolium TaxID=2727402 RepID=A0AAW2VJ60_9LAMI
MTAAYVGGEAVAAQTGGPRVAPFAMGRHRPWIWATAARSKGDVAPNDLVLGDGGRPLSSRSLLLHRRLVANREKGKRNK